MIKYLQINLDGGRQAQDLLKQTALEKDIDILLINEQYQKQVTGTWFQDLTAKAAIAVLNPNLSIKEVNELSVNFVWAEIEGTRLYKSIQLLFFSKH